MSGLPSEQVSAGVAGNPVKASADDPPRGVSFSENQVTIPNPTHDDENTAAEEDPVDLHYSNLELQQMRNRTVLVVRAMARLLRRGRLDDPNVSEELKVMHGVEKMLSPEVMIQSLEQRQAQIEAVLNEQHLQGDRRDFDPETMATHLAEVSSRHSEVALERAKAIGLKHFYEREAN